MKTNEPASNPQPINNLPTTEVPTSQKSVASKKITNWLLVGLIILLLGITGFFVYKYYQLKQQLVETQPIAHSKTSPSPALSPPPEIDPTADWKEVQIKDLNVDPETKIGADAKGLEIKYPQDWFYLSGESLGGTGAGDFVMSFQSDKILDVVPQEEIQIQIYLVLPPQEGLYEFVNNYKKTGLISSTKININDFEGYKGETNKKIMYFLKIDENNIAHIYVTPKDSDLIGVSEQIISTLNFID